MNEQRIRKYFSQKPHTLTTLFAVVLACLGFCVILLLPAHYWALGICLLGAGGGLFLMLSLQIKDSEVSEAAQGALTSFRETFEYEFIFRDTRKLHQAELRGIRHKDPVYESSYLASGEGLLTRKGNDGKIRSSRYQCVGILKEDDDICFGTQTFSLIGGEETKPQLMRVAYGELSHLALGEAYPQMHLAMMEVYGADGHILMSFQMRADAQTDDLIADINAKIRKTREE